MNALAIIVLRHCSCKRHSVIVRDLTKEIDDYFFMSSFYIFLFFLYSIILHFLLFFISCYSLSFILIIRFIILWLVGLFFILILIKGGRGRLKNHYIQLSLKFHKGESQRLHKGESEMWEMPFEIFVKFGNITGNAPHIWSPHTSKCQTYSCLSSLTYQIG